ncbi:hypothetical protein LP420_38085 [Massilia sp. B-10]|nr:hypothetical protein LP420_38085 [Massilia sp. B-10]
MSSAHSICVAAPEKTKCGREVHSGLKVSLGMDSHYFKIGETVPIKVWIENSGESVLKIPVLMEPEDYWLRFEITDSAGKALTFTGPETKRCTRTVPLCCCREIYLEPNWTI